MIKSFTDAALLAEGLRPIIERVRCDKTAVKADGRISWTAEPLTLARLAEHIAGGRARGVCPIKAGESITRLALIDLDSHQGETTGDAMAAAADRISTRLEELGMRPIPFRSSGGRGIHLYMLWDAPQDAYSVRMHIRRAIAAEGFTDGTGGVAVRQVEIFPKQDRVPADGHGSQFILPLAGASVPLLPLFGLAPGGRDEVLRVEWSMSVDVPRYEPENRTEVGTLTLAPEHIAKIASALAAIPNDGADAQDYDTFRNIGFAVHEATGGSDAGRDAFLSWCRRSPKFDLKFTIERVWNCMRPASARTTAVSRATLYKLANANGWQGWQPDAATLAEGFEDEGSTLTAAPIARRDTSGDGLSGFYAYLPQHQYLHRATGALWPGASVDASIELWPTNFATGKPMPPSQWLDKKRAVHQMTWLPGEGELIEDRAVLEGGSVASVGNRIFNLYRAPAVVRGDALNAGRWLDHLHCVYPDDATHIQNWLAHRVQKAHEKINHALVLSGDQGIGKDSLFQPARLAIGAWNWQDISPSQLLGRFNGWAKSVVLRVSEARDLGDMSRFEFYEATKTLIAAPPEVIRVDEKNLREHYVPNTLGMIITTNHRTDGLYLPADDRRHYVAWSNKTKADFTEAYWNDLWNWYEAGGANDVGTYLATLDLSKFNPKAPPPKTQAFWIMVSGGEAPETNELRDLLDSLPSRDAFTLGHLLEAALNTQQSEAYAELAERGKRRQVPRKLASIGYVSVRNPTANDGAWLIAGRRQCVYSRQDMSYSDQVAAARRLK